MFVARCRRHRARGGPWQARNEALLFERSAMRMRQKKVCSAAARLREEEKPQGDAVPGWTDAMRGCQWDGGEAGILISCR